jgi:hypothetical protein
MMTPAVPIPMMSFKATTKLVSVLVVSDDHGALFSDPCGGFGRLLYGMDSLHKAIQASAKLGAASRKCSME